MVSQRLFGSARMRSRTLSLRSWSSWAPCAGWSSAGWGLVRAVVSTRPEGLVAAAVVCRRVRFCGLGADSGPSRSQRDRLPKRASANAGGARRCLRLVCWSPPFWAAVRRSSRSGSRGSPGTATRSIRVLGARVSLHDRGPSERPEPTAPPRSWRPRVLNGRPHDRFLQLMATALGYGADSDKSRRISAKERPPAKGGRPDPLHALRAPSSSLARVAFSWFSLALCTAGALGRERGGPLTRQPNRLQTSR